MLELVISVRDFWKYSLRRGRPELKEAVILIENIWNFIREIVVDLHNSEVSRRELGAGNISQWVMILPTF